MPFPRAKPGAEPTYRLRDATNFSNNHCAFTIVRAPYKSKQLYPAGQLRALPMECEQIDKALQLGWLGLQLVGATMSSNNVWRNQFKQVVPITLSPPTRTITF